MNQPARPRPPAAALKNLHGESSPPTAAAPLRRLFDPLRHAAAAFFKHDVALRRAPDGLHIVLEERSPGRPRPDTPAEAAARKQAQDLLVMRSQLRALLDELPGTRPAMRHLVFVEKALSTKGLAALERLPLDVLQRALEQFEGLVTNWSPVGLAALRSKIAVAIIEREQREGDADASQRADSMSLADGQTLPLPLVEAADDEALAAAYAALGTAAPAGDAGDARTPAPGGDPAAARELQREGA